MKRIEKQFSSKTSEKRIGEIKRRLNFLQEYIDSQSMSGPMTLDTGICRQMAIAKSSKLFMIVHVILRLRGISSLTCTTRWRSNL